MEPAKSTKITIKKKKKTKITKRYLYISNLPGEQCMASLFKPLRLFYVDKVSMQLSTYSETLKLKSETKKKKKTFIQQTTNRVNQAIQFNKFGISPSTLKKLGL